MGDTFGVFACTAIVCATLVALFYHWGRAWAIELFMVNLGERVRDLNYGAGAIDLAWQRKHGADMPAIELRARRHWSELGGKGQLSFQDDRISVGAGQQ